MKNLTLKIITGILFAFVAMVTFAAPTPIKSQIISLNNTINYVYDEESHLLGEYTTQGRPIKEYIWIKDTPVAVAVFDPRSTTTPPAFTLYYIHVDHLNTPRQITDQTQRIVWRWDNLDVFGNNAPDEDPDRDGIKFTFNLRFPGMYFDEESGLFYNMNRYYDPKIGRYIQPDPIGLNAGNNRYNYVNSDPLRLTDPLGLEWQGTIGVSVSFGGHPLPFLPGPFVGGGVSIGFTTSGQFIIQTQATASIGVGAYAGVGAQGQVSKSKCSTPTGISTQRSAQGDVNFGWGPSIGGSAQYDGNGGGGLSTGMGRIGAGFGFQASGGVTQTTTIATPALFPGSNCGCP